MSKYPTFDKLVIQYDTGPLPPPYCHRYTISISNNSGKYFGSLNLEYYDRDEISEEEILEEGFSLKDDYHWEGHLPEVWGRILQKNINKSNWMTKPANKTQMAILDIRITSKGRSELIFPADKRIWEIFSQEIIQAIFELSKKEAPLTIEFANRSTDKGKGIISFKFNFSIRNVEIHSSNKKNTSIPWEQGQKLLKYIYYFEYLPEDGSSKLPSKPGHYLKPGDGLWYDLKVLDKGNIDKRKDRLIETLKSYS